MTTTTQGALRQSSCVAELDGAVALYNQGRSAAAKRSLEKLEEECAHMPQVHHNLGVMAAELKNWQSSANHFQKAMENDSRTNATLSHLQSIHQYRASVAYQNALGVKTTIALPTLKMQDSTQVNTDYRELPKTDLHNVPTVDYELYSWWTAAAENAISDWLEHYIQGYPPMENGDASQVNWADVNRSISFTAQDAVVVLNYQANNIDKRTLLLLRLQNKRWKIYQEASL